MKPLHFDSWSVRAAASTGLALAVAAALSVSDAVSWLEDQQEPSGSWGGTFELVDAATALETLAIVAPSSPAVESAVEWLAGNAPANHEELARSLAAFARVADATAFAADAAADLLAVQNPVEPTTTLPNWPEGGWGIAPGFETDCTTTALALLGLQAAGLGGGISVESEPIAASTTKIHPWTIAAGSVKARILITVSGGTVRLRMKEGTPPGAGDPFFSLAAGTWLITFPDSGLAFTPGSNFISIQTLAAASNYTFTASYEAPEIDTRRIEEGLNYLEESQNPDGGWGLQRGLPTEFYTSLHVMLALQAYLGYDLDSERALAQTYLEGQQLGDGSFGFGGSTVSYVTALGALNLLRADPYPFDAQTTSALAALNALQDVDGSWDAEAYHTALGALAIWEANQAPAADAGPDQSVTDSDEDGVELVQLAGSGSDVDGFIADYSWFESGAPIASGSAPSISLAVGVHQLDLTVTDDGGKEASDSVQITVAGSACDPVSGLACSSAGGDVLLSWTNESNYTHINLYQDGFLFTSLAGSETSYTHVGVPTGAIYAYAVQGVCATGSSGLVECDVLHADPCAPISGLACGSSGEDVQLAWTNGASYQSVEIRRDGNLIASLVGTATSHVDADVPSGNYTYSVRGICPLGVAAPDVDCAVDHANPCFAVTDLACAQAFPDVELAWTNADAYAEVNVYRDGGLIATLAGGSTAYTDVAPDIGSYVYTVEGVCGPGRVASGVDCEIDHLCPGGASLTPRVGLGLNVPASLFGTPPGNLPKAGNAAFALGVDDPTAACGIPPGSFTAVALATLPSAIPVPAWGCGGGLGQILIGVTGSNPFLITPPTLWVGPGSPSVHALPIPAGTSFCGFTIYAQAAWIAPPFFAFPLSEALDIQIGS